MSHSKGPRSVSSKSFRPKISDRSASRRGRSSTGGRRRTAAGAEPGGGRPGEVGRQDDRGSAAVEGEGRRRARTGADQLGDLATAPRGSRPGPGCWARVATTRAARAAPRRADPVPPPCSERQPREVFARLRVGCPIRYQRPCAMRLPVAQARSRRFAPEERPLDQRQDDDRTVGDDALETRRRGRRRRAFAGAGHEGREVPEPMEHDRDACCATRRVQYAAEHEGGRRSDAVAPTACPNRMLRPCSAPNRSEVQHTPTSPIPRRSPRGAGRALSVPRLIPTRASRPGATR